MAARIQVVNLQKKVRLNPNLIQKTAKKILSIEGVSKATLSVVFASDRIIKSLNKKFLKKSYATDVLAFDLRDRKRQGQGKPKDLFGEIVVSTDTASRNAIIYQTTVKEELMLYLIHGILHLLGYDDHNPSEVRRMRQKENKLLALLRK